MTAMNYYGPSRYTSAQGKETLAAAVSIEWDWSLPESGFNKMAEAIEGLSDDDLEAALRLVGYLDEAIRCALINRDRIRDTAPGDAS